ncbi:hypothetical protein OBBRIDRAFT_889953 [Obba rivulosa]|uniref:F-box domain-containing protein n=1 Tax=Obba rivulosa TaxID=1052685 RepID=A0A8E2DLU4_9APHY|nr:hypothetical protein OBBRIDRAFT_889953 [Obba rivulosa]
MASRRVLHCYDVLTLIFNQLSVHHCVSASVTLAVTKQVLDMQKSLKRKALARAARVCKLWSEIALRVLWNELDSAGPLLNLFSTFTPAQPEVGRENALLGEVFPFEWARFCGHASHVRRLKLDYSDRDLFDGVRILASLVPHNGGLPLFPRLVQADFESISAEEFMALASIVPPTLPVLRLDFGQDFDSGRHWETLLSKGGPSAFLQSKLPLLQDLQLLLHNPSVLIPRESAIPFSNIRQINICSGFPIAPLECWAFFALMKNLEELHIDILNSREELFHIGGFPAIKRLFITTQSWESVDYALQSITSKHLKRVQISRYTVNSFHDGPSALKDTLATLCTKFGRSLRCIEINTPFRVTDAVDGGTVNLVSECLSPLLDLRDLESVHFGRTTRLESRADSAIHVQLSDDDLDTMAAAWPRLAELRLLLGRSAHISTIALTALAGRCPLLAMLELPMLDVFLTPSNPIPHSLQSLALADYVGAPTDFAAFLDAVFPDVILTRSDEQAETRARQPGWDARCAPFQP